MPAPLHVHFVNENISGHATMHLGLRRYLSDHREIETTIHDCRGRSILVRLAGRRIPGLSRLDLDYAVVRDQLARSMSVRRHLANIDAPDVLHVYTQNIALASTEYMKRVPTVVSTDTTNTLLARLAPWGRRRVSPTTLAASAALEGRVFRAAAMVVAHSQWAARSILESGVAPERVCVIPFGIVIPEDAPRRTSPRARIAFIGNSMERKGGWRLLGLWRRELKPRCDLTLVTPEAVPEEEGLEVRNDVRPDNGRIWEILERTDVLAFPSTIDPFGYAVIEAMAAGVPVVAAADGARLELIQDGVTGILYDPKRPDGLRDALETLLADRDAAADMGRAARTRAMTYYDARVTTGQLVEVLTKVARHRAAGGH